VKTSVQNLFLVLACTGLPAMPVAAQTFTTLYSFTDGNDGANPQASLILSGNALYGTTTVFPVDGTVFKINTDGTCFTNLYNFTALSGSFPNPPTNSDGANLHAALILSGNTLYGTAVDGGTNGAGTVFAVNTDGTGFTNLHTFAFDDGAQPFDGLILSSNTLYGTTRSGGSWQWGTIFAVNTDGTGFTNLYSFTGGNDGGLPLAGLTLSGNTLYGTTFSGGSYAENNPNIGGTVFAINTDGTGFTNLYSFTGDNDGDNPQAVLVLSGNTLYGTTSQGGSSSNGTVFAINTDGTGFTNLYSFSASSGSLPNIINEDGAFPDAGLILLGNTLYGTASLGGSSGCGTVFAINTDGTGFTNLYSFSAGSGSLANVTNEDGAFPNAGLILSGNTLYGTAASGGSSGYGTVFSLSFAPQLTINISGTNVILTWPTNVAGFDYSGFILESTANLVSPALWTTVSPIPVVVNGQNTVTNPISYTQQFYRLSQYLNTPPAGMALIPAGEFTIGDTLDGESDAIPTNVYVSAFYMDTNLVSYSQWQLVYNWATNAGYGFDNAGSAKTINQTVQPVQTVSWYDCVKWCNARSQQAGLTPVYYTDAGLTQVYTNGYIYNGIVYPNWAVNGYRLPTEAEWEKAARGGLSGQRFPWGLMISESQANYYAEPGIYSYDLGPYHGYNANFDTGGMPYTSPVGYFAPNGYGLYDMAGNVWEWCWDWYGTPYGQPTTNNPTGPAWGSLRILRGDSWNLNTYFARCADRYVDPPRIANGRIGFRCVMAP
jgi:uncharacterized repeat protein (TIGR03803 family)